MTVFFRVMVTLLSSIYLSAAFGQQENVYAFTSPKDTLRFQQLTQEIRCIVCQNQNIADSGAPLAKDLKDKIYHFIQEKKSDQEIKHFLVQRYGEFILLKPSFSPLTFILWLFPFTGVIGVFVGMILLHRRKDNTGKG